MTTTTTLGAHMIRRDLIDPSPTNPRKRFDEQGLRELAATMANDVGIIEPLVVRLGKKPGRYELVAGERRWRAAAIAKLDDVPVVVRVLSDEQVIEIQIIENEKRRDIHALEQSDAFVTWQKLNPKLTTQLLAERIGMSDRYVQNLLHYQKLIPAVREAFYDNKITAGHADLIVRLPPAQQKEALEACSERDYDAERELADGHAGLFADERQGSAGKQSTIVRTVSVRALDDWIKSSIRLQPETAPAEFFPELADALSAPGTALPTLLQVADTYSYNPTKGEKAPFPLNNQQWQATAGKKCEHQQRAVVVLGPKRGRIIDVCTAKGKCKVHWSWTVPTPIPSNAAKSKPHKKTPAELKFEAQARERKQRAELWEAVKPDALKLGLAAARTVKPAVAATLIGAFMKEELFTLDIPKKPTLADLVAAVVKEDANDDTVFGSTAKLLGINLKPLFAAAERIKRYGKMSDQEAGAARIREMKAKKPAREFLKKDAPARIKKLLGKRSTRKAGAKK